MKDGPLIVCCHRNAPGWRWIAASVDGGGLDWEFVRPARHGQWPMVRAAARVAWAARRRGAAMVVTHGPHISVRCALALRAIGGRAPHLAYSFHYDEVPPAGKRRLISRAFRGVDRIINYSRWEADLYSEKFDIPREKFVPVYWGIQPPDPAPEAGPSADRDYLSSIGGSSRDYRTLFAAMERVPHVPLVAVMRPQNLEGLGVPANVQVRVDIPYAEVVEVMRAGRGTIIPLLESAKSGHSMLVLAMHHGKATLISEVPGVREYVRDGETVLTCAPGDPAAMAAQIARLWEDAELRQRLATGGKQFALAHCTEAAVADRFQEFLREFGIR